MTSKNKKTILFLCTGNSIRSQMAEGFGKNIFPENWKTYSAGTSPCGINPLSIKVMAELGIDISKQKSKHINDIPEKKIDLVITLCGSARDRCTITSKNIQTEHWPIKDPFTMQGNDIENFRKIRDEIKKRIIKFIKKI